MVAIKKRVVLGITGGIAAYKACDITRELKRRQFDVRVVMTADAQRFISPLTLHTLSQNPVATDLFTQHPFGPAPHIELAGSMDLLLVAPATANSIAKFANGMAGDLLSALFLATRSPVLLAPAMNPAMYSHKMVQKNIQTLRDMGVLFVEPVSGKVACGQEGKGHIAPVDAICDRAEAVLTPKTTLKGRSFLITAGPTREYIDPIRFISNSSSGKMGYALADEARKRGAEVILISGPSSLPPPDGIRFVPVTSAQDMFTEVTKAFPSSDIIIMSAAVTDFTPRKREGEKIKKFGIPSSLEILPTTDILSDLGKRKGKGQMLIGFAAEDRELLENAFHKLKQKNLDLIVANDISYCAKDTNKVTLLTPLGEQRPIPEGEKGWVAEKILDYVEKALAHGPLGCQEA